MMQAEMFHVKHWRGRGRSVERGSVAALAAMLALAGCSAPEDIAERTGITAPVAAAATGKGGASATAAAASASVAGGPARFTDNSESEGATREFSYAWPGAAAAIPALAEYLAADRDRALAEQKTEWAEALAEFAGEECAMCKTRSYEQGWEVVADLPRFLSLSSTIAVYTGGAHGNGFFDALVWDREAGRGFNPKAMFRTEAALQDALGDPWCAALTRERGKRMGNDYSDDGFFTCPAIADLTLLVGSGGKRGFDRIGLLAAPYVAGSYAEGTYEVTLPVTPKVLAAVKGEYKSAFALGK
jgi:hypothetical protein